MGLRVYQEYPGVQSFSSTCTINKIVAAHWLSVIKGVGRSPLLRGLASFRQKVCFVLFSFLSFLHPHPQQCDSSEEELRQALRCRLSSFVILPT